MLQPGRIHGSAIHWINHDLRIKLRRTPSCNPALRLPAGSVVCAFHQDHGRHRTRIAAWNLDVLRVENIDMAVAIGRKGGFPLVSQAQPYPILGRKSDTYRMRRKRQRSQQEGDGGNPQTVKTMWQCTPKSGGNRKSGLYLETRKPS